MNRTEKVIITCTMVVCILVLFGISKIREGNQLSMRSLCRSDMIAAEVSKLDKGIAVDLYRFTNGRSAREMEDLPQCKGVAQ